MSELTASDYDRLDQCRAEIAFLRATIGSMGDIVLDKESTFGLFVILSRAEETLSDFLGKGREKVEITTC